MGSEFGATPATAAAAACGSSTSREMVLHGLSGLHARMWSTATPNMHTPRTAFATPVSHSASAADATRLLYSRTSPSESSPIRRSPCTPSSSKNARAPSSPPPANAIPLSALLSTSGTCLPSGPLPAAATAVATAEPGSGRRLRSTLPLEVWGSSFMTIKADGTMCLGSTACRACRASKSLHPQPTTPGSPAPCSTTYAISAAVSPCPCRSTTHCSTVGSAPR
jgi:hypothetical protein